LALRAVVFDYGMVLTGPPDPLSHDALLRITGLPHDRFEALYWADRHAYDEGKLSGPAFWKNFLADSALNLGQGAVEELNRWDARMWTTQNPVMLAWQQAIKKIGLRTAILSNMGDSVLANMQREFDWLDRFDVSSGATSTASPSRIRPSTVTRLHNSARSPPKLSSSMTGPST